MSVVIDNVAATSGSHASHWHYAEYDTPSTADQYFIKEGAKVFRQGMKPMSAIAVRMSHAILPADRLPHPIPVDLRELEDGEHGSGRPI